MLAKDATADKFHQLPIKGLGRGHRCVLCHVGIDGKNWQLHREGKRHQGNLQRLFALVPGEGGETISCAVCSVKVSSESWKEHLEDEGHRQRMEVFLERLRREDRDLLSQELRRTHEGDFLCGACGAYVAPANLKEHRKGNAHQLRLVDREQFVFCMDALRAVSLQFSDRLQLLIQDFNKEHRFDLTRFAFYQKQNQETKQVGYALVYHRCIEAQVLPFLHEFFDMSRRRNVSSLEMDPLSPTSAHVEDAEAVDSWISVDVHHPKNEN